MAKPTLDELYFALDILKQAGISPESSQLQTIEDLEDEYINENVIPLIRETVSSKIKDIKRPLTIEINYLPDEDDLQISILRQEDVVVSSTEELSSILEGSIQQYAQSEPSTKKRLIVEFPDGTVFESNKAKEVLANTIEKFGIERVRSLNLQMNYYPLVSDKLHEKYAYAQVEIGGYYLMTNCSTKAKKRLIENIAKQLGEQVSVRIIMPDGDHYTTSSYSNQRQQGPRTNLRVTLPDGTVIERNAAWRTFIEAILYIGVDKAKQYDRKIVGIPLISDRLSDNERYSRSQKLIAPNTYLNCYHSTETKKSILDELADRFDIDMDVEIVRP